MNAKGATGARDDRRTGLSRNVLGLGIVSFLTDTASEMVVPLLPAFLTSVLGASALALGWIEGAADALSSLLKLLSGRWSDRASRRRPFVVVGYFVASAARPLVALATVPGHVLAVRLTDRAGKGLRSSPRDALIAASVPAGERGSAYGFHRAMDHAGAVLGPLVALGVLTVFTTDLRTLFWLSAAPGALAVAAVLIFVRESETPVRKPATAPPIGHGAPSPALIRFLVPLGLFSLANASDLFLLLKAGAARTPLYGLPLLWMAFNGVKSMSSLLGGWLADRAGAQWAITLGWALYLFAYLGLAIAETPGWVAALFVLYGLHHGLSEAPEKTLVAELVSERERASAFGWYHLTVGLLVLPASVLFGWLWESFGSSAAFFASAGLALGGLALFRWLAPWRTNG